MRPIASLTFLIVLIAFSSCKKKQDDLVIVERAIFSAEINEEKISLIESDSLEDVDTYIQWTPSRLREVRGLGYTVEVWGLNLGKPIRFDIPVTDLISINFVNHFEQWQYEENDNISQSLFEEILSKGVRYYTQNYIEKPGIVIEWNDKDGEKWTTDEVFFSGESITAEVDNSDSYFKVNQSIFLDDRSVEPLYYQYLELLFNCRLYNIKGQSIYLDNGSFKCIYRSFNRAK